MVRRWRRELTRKRSLEPSRTASRRAASSCSLRLGLRGNQHRPERHPPVSTAPRRCRARSGRCWCGRPRPESDGARSMCNSLHVGSPRAGEHSRARGLRPWRGMRPISACSVARLCRELLRGSARGRAHARAKNRGAQTNCRRRIEVLLPCAASQASVGRQKFFVAEESWDQKFGKPIHHPPSLPG